MTLLEIFSKVLNMSLTASLVIVLVIAARFVLRKSPKVFSYALWAVVLFRLLCPVSIPSPVSLLGLLDVPVAHSEGVTSSIEYIPYEMVVNTTAAIPQLSDNLPPNTTVQAPAQSQQVTAEPQRKSVSVAEIMTCVWIVGIAVMAIGGMGSYLRFRKHLTGAVQVQDNIYLVDHIDSAYVAGLICPKIYLPSDIPLNQRGYIIAHEQYHIRRMDHVIKHLSFAALCIHWFNPLVWVAFVLSGKDLEMSCDEAVIKKMGEDIRADYSVSLLTLATGRRIIAGTPLAFGEGDTKGRIKNMANWKQPKKWVSIVSFILCFSILTACAANPDQEVVISKNDGSFDINVVQSATQPTDQDGTDTQNVQYTDSFTSTDGSVEFQLNVNETLTAYNMPVVEVVPHYLTEEDAKRVARVLFGDADFYEKEPTIGGVMSKSDIQACINRWSFYTSTDNLMELYGNDMDQSSLEMLADDVKAYIEAYTKLYDAAPDGNPHTPCEWTFKPDTYYEDAEKVAAADLSDDNEEIKIALTVGDIPYQLAFSRRNQDDFKLNYIYAFPDSGQSPWGIDNAIFHKQMCRTDKPTQAQIAAIGSKAQQMLDEMDLGEWIVDECYLQTSYVGEYEHYVIYVNAVPVFNGVPAVRRPQLTDLNSKKSYASNYYLTDANFQFSVNGDLKYFSMYSTIDVQEVLNENVATLTMPELVEKAKTQLSLSDYNEYGIGGEALAALERDAGEEMICKIDICELEYGMTRVKVPNTDDSYYYVPAVTFSGTVDYVGRDSGKVYEASGETIWDDRMITLLAINAVDGSIIQLYTK